MLGRLGWNVYSGNECGGRKKMNAKRAPRKARVIAIGNQKGGVGKSTLAVHLSAALGERGQQCLIWDLDMNRGATLHGPPGRRCADYCG